MRPIPDRDRGFTLIEVTIVVVVIAILATIAVPKLIRGKMQANESAVISTMRSLAQAQAQFKTLNLDDLNGDGAYEYGLLTEITGSGTLRGSTERLAPRLLSESLGLVDAAGHIVRHGYYFAVHLPDAAGVGLTETAANLGNIDPIRAADFWTCLAWPMERDATGRSVFFVNQQGQILETGKAPYSGLTSVPPAGAALVGPDPTHIDAQELAIGVTAADGYVWTVAN